MFSGSQGSTNSNRTRQPLCFPEEPQWHECILWEGGSHGRCWGYSSQGSSPHSGASARYSSALRDPQPEAHVLQDLLHGVWSMDQLLFVRRAWISLHFRKYFVGQICRWVGFSYGLFGEAGNIGGYAQFYHTSVLLHLGQASSYLLLRFSLYCIRAIL